LLKEIEGIKVNIDKFLDEISVEDGNELLKAALELNPLEQITAV
jgi:hypothetical protein